VKQFSIQKLFLMTTLVAGLVALVANETVGTVCASLFCLTSWCAIFFLSTASLKHLVRSVSSTVGDRQIGRLTSRFRWAYLDASCVVWLVIVVVVSNYVLENSVANAKYMIFLGWTVFSIAVVGQLVLHLINRKAI
jgi:hypothetical protein